MGALRRLLAPLAVLAVLSASAVAAVQAPAAQAAPVHASAAQAPAVSPSLAAADLASYKAIPQRRHPHAHSIRMRAWNWAQRYGKGCPYVWGGAGPCSSGYDCSGEVMRAYQAAGVSLPHQTESMVESGLLRQISAGQARKGDLAMWFSGGTAVHVMLVAYLDRWIFGATEQGQLSGLHRTWGSPVYYRVVRYR